MGIGLLGASPVLLLFLLGYCLAVIDGELRCYCNESGCVSTGYMCKSAVGMCFTSIAAGPGVEGDEVRPHTTHGCLDSLPARHRVACKSSGVDVVGGSAATAASLPASSGSSPTVGGTLQKLPLLLCCSEHMCNYEEDTETAPLNHPKTNNGTLLRGKSSSKEDKAVSRNQGSSRDDDRDLWFKAAVIAVPIAGGFILVLLVLLAVRMLRTDTRQHRRLIQIQQDRNFTKAHMYISDNFVGKKHQCSLFNEKTGKICSILYPPEKSTPCSITPKQPTPKPIVTSNTHKHPPHRHAYIGLFGSDTNKYDKRNKRLKDSTSSTVGELPTPLKHSTCDRFLSTNSSSNSKTPSDSGCCKEHCCTVHSNVSINSTCSNKSHRMSSGSGQDSLPDTGEPFTNDNNSKKTIPGEKCGPQGVQHADLSSCNDL